MIEIRQASLEQTPWSRASILDTHRPKLRRFHEGFGFVAVKDTTVFGFEVTLYELKL